MWDFVNKGVAGSSGSGTGANNSSGGKNKVLIGDNGEGNSGGRNRGGVGADMDNGLDDLLSGLDDVTSARPRNSGGIGGGVRGRSLHNRHQYGSSGRSRSSAASSSSRHTPTSSRQHTTPASSARKRRAYGSSGDYGLVNTSGRRKLHSNATPGSSRRGGGGVQRNDTRAGDSEEEPIDFNNRGYDEGEDDADFGNDGGDVDFGGEDNGNDTFEEDGDVNGEKAESNEEVEGEQREEDSSAEAAATEATSSRPRKIGRLAARKEAQEKAAAQKKLLEEQQKQTKKMDDSKPKEKVVTFEEDIKVDMTSTSFRPDSIAAASAEVGGGNNADLELIVETEDVEMKDAENESEEEAKEPRQYLDMFWLDAAERNGVVYLYGKVRIPSKDPSKQNYQSCCVTVPNNQRNLFVLPRVKSTNPDEGQERYGIMDVYNEIKSVLTPSCIPHTEGSNWAGKKVTRSYAFEDPSIPRGECDYLKVKYDGKYPVPNRDVCVNGGKSFEKILGAGASNLENFLLKRDLMGPQWVRIYNPKSIGGSISWCKWECTVAGPKSIVKLESVKNAAGEKVAMPPTPTVSTVSIKFKTVVNPKSHKLEIVCVSAICHNKVQLDSASDESTRHMTQLTLVRPLSHAESNGTMPQFPRDMEKEMKQMPELQKCPNERALLSRLFAQIGQWDPDVLVSHNGWGHDIDVLLSRCVELKVSMWSKIGRRRQMKLPNATQFGNGKEWAIANALDGRILCDTCISAKELLRETTYSLTNLTLTQLKMQRVEIEPVDVPKWCRDGKHFVSLAQHTLNDAQLVQRLMFKLQILPLTKQLTNIAGNLWARTMKGNRAERNEYLLLHEFHNLKYLVPEKRTAKQRSEELGEEGGASNGKAKYSGGLVLEPKKGLYDSFILLLDFNSLYPSLIQEYNLCFTTMEWSKSNAPANVEGGEVPQGDQLPPLPDEGLKRGVLPRVIKTLVDRRRNVKKFLKTEKNAEKKEEVSRRLFLFMLLPFFIHLHNISSFSLTHSSTFVSKP